MASEEAELLRGRALLDAIIKDVPDAIMLTNPDRRIVLANAAATRIFGYAPGELIGQKTLALYAEQSEFERQGAETFATPRRVDGERLELRMRRKSGEGFDAEVVVTSIQAEDGGKIGYLGIIRDVTERNAIADELQRTRQRLADAVEAL